MYWSRLLTVLVATVMLAYPLVVYFGIQAVEPRLLALILIVLLCSRLLLLGRNSQFRLQTWGAIAAFGGIAFFAILWNDAVPLKFYPVLINALMLFAFCYSLRNPPSAIERVARLTHPDLPPSGIAYTRRVTQLWSLFFFSIRSRRFTPHCLPPWTYGRSITV